MRLVLIAIFLLSAGCAASANLTVIRPLGTPLQEVSLRIEPGDQVNDQQQTHVRTVLTNTLTKSGVAVQSESHGATTLGGKIERYSPGNKTLRWFFGLFGAGHGTLESTWKIVDGAGQEVASCRVDGRIKMGAFGGEFDDVIKKVGERLGEFLSGSK